MEKWSYVFFCECCGEVEVRGNSLRQKHDINARKNTRVRLTVKIEVRRVK